jgi:uncharacterized protein
MERYQKVAEHKKLRYYMDKIALAEENRIFCRHNWEHLIAVARIAYILVLEEKLPISKDHIYAAALLHDIGKEAQYSKGIPHEIEGAALAEGILKDCGYGMEEIGMITEAILAHRDLKKAHTDFQKVLYRADKLSRPCRDCQAAAECNWPQEKKNIGVSI